MKNNKVIINPVGLKGNQINERMKELMGIAPINENKKTSVIELTKQGPDGNVYAIVRENHEYYIKSSVNKENLVAEDFNYIGGLKNKKSEAYPSYAKAIKHLNLKFNSLNEAFNKSGQINVFENDNLVAEDVAGYSEMKSNGFTGEGNLENNTPLTIENEEEGLTETEQAVEDMCEEDKKAVNNPWAICTSSVGRKDKKKYEACVKDVKKEKGVEESLTEEEFTKDSVVKENHKLSILRAVEGMDAIIESLSGEPVKKKVYSIK